MADRQLEGAVDKATHNRGFKFAARFGFVTSGVLHLLVAYIILRIAFGSAGNADQSGALATLAASPGGALVLWIAAVGLVAMALWRLAETILGPHPSEHGVDQGEGRSAVTKRLQAAGLAIVYFALAYSAIRFAMGSGKSAGQQNAGLSAQLMQTGWGKTLLVLVGLGIVAVGGYHVYKGVSKGFLKDLSEPPSGATTTLGVVGYAAKGLVLAGAGILVIVAAMRSDPTKSTGLDGAVKTLGEAPFGKVLLVVAALGFAAFGLFSFVQSRYGRM
ncbi:MAG: hypothetical protein JWR37_2502 [Mycobacterium sp.]|jgi:hypothetical protein|nr:hypothetical protein [Mycobacterium sp.]